MIKEACVESFEKALEAQNHGANRIELCENLIVGGTTPSYGTVKICLEKLNIPIFPMIRARGGNFVYSKDEMTLWGEPAEILRHLLEIRGVGIIDVMSLYGASAVKDSSQVQIAVYLENYDVNKAFDRLGNASDELEIAGVRIPRVRIPVKTGRNISVVIEAAAMNYRAKEMGFDATRLFEERLTNLIAQNEVPNA